MIVWLNWAEINNKWDPYVIFLKFNEKSMFDILYENFCYSIISGEGAQQKAHALQSSQLIFYHKYFLSIQKRNKKHKSFQRQPLGILVPWGWQYVRVFKYLYRQFERWMAEHIVYIENNISDILNTIDKFIAKRWTSDM